MVLDKYTRPGRFTVLTANIRVTGRDNVSLNDHKKTCNKAKFLASFRSHPEGTAWERGAAGLANI